MSKIKISIKFEYIDKYNQEYIEQIICDAPIDENGKVEEKFIFDKIKDYGYPKSRCTILSVRLYDQLISKEIELIK